MNMPIIWVFKALAVCKLLELFGELRPRVRSADTKKAMELSRHRLSITRC